MLELIDREHFINIMHGKQKYTSDAGYFEALQFAIERARELPTIEPEVRRGEWIPAKSTISSKCSACGKYSPSESPFCPRCGAYMR